MHFTEGLRKKPRIIIFLKAQLDQKKKAEMGS